MCEEGREKVRGSLAGQTFENRMISLPSDPKKIHSERKP